MPIITIAQDCLLNRRSCVNNIHTQSLDLYFIAYFKIQFKVDWILKNRLRSKVLKICEGKTHNNGNENNFEWPTMHKKMMQKSVKMILCYYKKLCYNKGKSASYGIVKEKISNLWNCKNINLKHIKGISILYTKGTQLIRK